MISSVHESPATRRRPRRQTPVNLKFDIPFFLAIFTLLVFGAIMVYSASWDLSFYYYDDASLMFRRQMLWLALGLVLAAAASMTDYHYYRKVIVPGMLVTLGALLLVLLRSEVRYGAARTLNSGSFMPSEAAKLVTIIYLSIWLYSKRNQLNDISFGLIPLGVILGAVSGFILAQPDLSAAATIFFLGGLLFFLAGGELKQIFVLLVLAVFVGWVVVQIHPTGNKRITNFLQAVDDPTQADYHVKRSFGAFLNGGMFGTGIGKSTAKLTGLPVPPTDSIFAVIGEETGVAGTSIMIGLYLLLLWRGMHIAKNAPDMLGSLMAAGLTLWITLEAIINMAVMVGMLPFAGNALPFISVGGSSLIVSLIAVGIILNISRNSNQPNLNPQRTSNALDGMRRGYRGRSISRPGGAPGSR